MAIKTQSAAEAMLQRWPINFSPRAEEFAELRLKGSSPEEAKAELLNRHAHSVIDPFGFKFRFNGGVLDVGCVQEKVVPPKKFPQGGRIPYSATVDEFTVRWAFIPGPSGDFDWEDVRWKCKWAVRSPFNS